MKKSFFYLALFFCHGAYAADSLKGIGLVKIASKHVRVELHQAIQISESQVFFAGLDDFGEVTFRVDFTAQTTMITDRKLKQILSLPLTRAEFLELIRHRKPESFSDISSEVLSGEMATEVWHHQHRKKLRVVFSDFSVLATQEVYPKQIRISYKKNHFDLKWQSLEAR
jgi:hypothetical protein